MSRVGARYRMFLEEDSSVNLGEGCFCWFHAPTRESSYSRHPEKVEVLWEQSLGILVKIP